jgi:hypothetical protein
LIQWRERLKHPLNLDVNSRHKLARYLDFMVKWSCVVLPVFYTIVDTFLRGQVSNIESGDCTHLSSLTSKLLASFCGQNRGVSTMCQTHLQS